MDKGVTRYANSDVIRTESIVFDPLCGSGLSDFPMSVIRQPSSNPDQTRKAENQTILSLFFYAF